MGETPGRALLDKPAVAPKPPKSDFFNRLPQVSAGAECDVSDCLAGVNMLTIAVQTCTIGWPHRLRSPPGIHGGMGKQPVLGDCRGSVLRNFSRIPDLGGNKRGRSGISTGGKVQGGPATFGEV